MATKIVTKNSSTAGSAPSASDLVQGELAVNVADKRLYTEDAAGAIVELGTNPSTLNVDGTATMDGLTFNSSASSSVTFPYNGFNYIDTTGAGAALVFRAGSTPTNALRLSSNGDVSFYEDTGTTAKFFWDASAERLGLGTTTPQRPLHLSIGTENTAMRVETTDTESGLEFIDPAGTAYFRASGDYIKMGATESDSLTILAGGNVGIGTDSPNYQLTIGDGTDALETVNIMSTDAGSSRLFFSDASSVGQGRLTYDHATNSLQLFTADTERMRISSSGGIESKAGINITGNGGFFNAANKFGQDQNGAVARMYSSGGNTTTKGSFEWHNTTSNGSGDTVGMTLDSSGTVFVGKTSQDLSTEGVSINPLGYIQVTESSSPALYLNRLSTDGSILNLYKDGTFVGGIGSAGTNAYIDSQGGTFKIATAGTERYNFDLDQIYPSVDNDTNLGLSAARFKDLHLSGSVKGLSTVGNSNSGIYCGTYGVYPVVANSLANSDNVLDLGQSSYRWQDIYATNGTIQTSDAREKTAVRELTDAEMRVAKKLSKNIGFFQ